MSPYRNLVDLHRRQAERLATRPALRGRRLGVFRDLIWSDYREQAVAAAAALVDAGVRPGDRVGLLSENRVDWLVADMAILTAGAVNVPPHAPLTAAQVRYQLADSGVRFLIVSGEEQMAKVRRVRGELPPLAGIVAFDRTADAEVVSWDAFLQAGRRALPRLAEEMRRREESIGLDDLATIMYTSGTTGNPKGVMLTHGNLLSNAEASAAAAPHRPNDVVLSWLPYTHIYARLVDHYAAMLAGVLVCVAASVDTLLDDLSEVRPTNFAAVPRFYEKVLAAVASKDPAETGRRLRKAFGGRVDWLSSGGAPLPPDVCRAYHDAGLLLLQGYGLTETSPVISFNRKEKFKIETVGPPLPGVEVRIAADGEVLTRGPHVMKGYWNMPEATAEAIRDGWFHTGDLGEMDADGFLKITGRKKDLLVLSNGKKVVPAFIEGLLLAEPCVDQAVVCGEGHNFLTALVVPHWDNVRRELSAAGVPATDEAVRDLLMRKVRGRLTDVSSAEQVKKIVVLEQPFSVAADEMTVSLKLRRNVILAKYRERIDALYREPAPADEAE